VALFAFDPQLFNANPVQASKIAVEWGHLADGYDPNEYSWEYTVSDYIDDDFYAATNWNHVDAY
jgi:hypothetical protein